MSIFPRLDERDIPDVLHELYPPVTGDSRREAFLACLRAWATVNGLPIDHVLGGRRITVDMSARTIDYWAIGDAPKTPGARVMQVPVSGDKVGSRWERLPLIAEPIGVLVGENLIGNNRCGHMVRRGTSTLRCNVEVDAFGQHPGVHADGLHDNTEWPNEHPGVLSYRRGRPDVTGRPPEEQHVLVLTAIEERENMAHTGVTAARDIEGLAGRRHILERHAPVSVTFGGTRCEHCNDRSVTSVRWPCEDYRDAAAGLVTGLETP